jgi:glucose-6-phosphate isomerase
VRLEVPQINPFTVGQLLYLWELVVWYLATLYGLDPFRAPAMEEYRRLLLAALGRKGLEDEAEEAEATLRQQPQWVV